MLEAVPAVANTHLSRVPEKSVLVGGGSSDSANSLATATGNRGGAASRGLSSIGPVDSRILQAAQDSLLKRVEAPPAGTRVRKALPGPETGFNDCQPNTSGQFNSSALAGGTRVADTLQGGFTGPVNQISSAASAFGATPFADIQSMEALVNQFFQQAQAIGAFRSQDVARVDGAIDGQLPDVMSLLTSQLFGNSVSPEFGQGLTLVIDNLRLSVGQSANGVSAFCEDSLSLPSDSCTQLAVLAQQLQDVVSDQMNPAYSSGMARISTALDAVMVQLRDQIHTSNALYKSDVDGSVGEFAEPIVRLTPSSTDITAARLNASDAFLGVVDTPARINSLYDALTTLVQSLFFDPNIQAASLAHDIPLLTAEQVRINDQKSDSSSEYNKLQDRISDKRRDFILSLVTSVLSLAYLIYTRVVVPRDVQRGYTRLTAFYVGSDIEAVSSRTMDNATVVPHVPAQYNPQATIDTQTQLKFIGHWFTHPSSGSPGGVQAHSFIQTDLDKLETFHHQLKECLSRPAYFELFKHFDSLETPTDILLLIGNLKKFYSTTGAPDAPHVLSGSTSKDRFTKILGGFLNGLIRVYNALYSELNTNDAFRKQFKQTSEFRQTISLFRSDADRIHRAFFPVNPKSLSATYEEPRATERAAADVRRASFIYTLTHEAAAQLGIPTPRSQPPRPPVRVFPAATSQEDVVLEMIPLPALPGVVEEDITADDTTA